MTKLAIVTGASRGIGKAAAWYFASRGYHLVLMARNEEDLKKNAQEIELKHRVTAQVYPLDVSDTSAVQQAIKAIAAAGKSIDVLFNSAGVLHRGSSAIAPDDFNQMIEVNLRGIYNLVHYCVPVMKQQQSGYIFNMASYAGQRPLAQSAAYCMTKYGVVGLSKSLSLELIADNIKVTAICPSVVDTDMTAGFADFPNEEKIPQQDVLQSLDYLLNLSPQSYVDEIIIKSSYMLKHHA